MPRRDRIVLCGSFGAGKTSIAQAWAEKIWSGGFQGQYVSFADPIRQEAALGIAVSDTSLLTHVGEITRYYTNAMEDPGSKDQYRGLLQELGKFRTNQHPNYWLEKFDRRYSSFVEAEVPMACGDCRLDNQMELLRRWDFTFILLEPGPYVREQGDRQNDLTEQYWPHWNYDYVLDFQEGVERQALRLIEEFGLDGYGSRS